MTGYPWESGDELLAADLNAAIANGAALGGGLLTSGGTMTGPISFAGHFASVLDITAATVTGPVFNGNFSASSINGTPVGTPAPSTAAFTTLSASGAVSGAGFTSLLAPYALTTSIPAASSALPIMDGTAAVGTGTTWARADHVHPTDTSRYAASNPSGYQTAAQVTTALAPYAPLASPTFTGTTTAANLTATGTVAGAGFSNYLASPPAIGGTTPAAGTFSALTTTGYLNIFANLANVYPPIGPGLSASIGWNFLNGVGEVDYWSNYTGGATLAHVFWQRTGASTSTRLMDIGITGAVTAYAGFVVSAAAGPTIRAGTGAATGTQPNGSLWLRTDGTAGARLYVSAGGGTWTAVATV